MYPVAILGNNPCARAAVLALKKAGFTELTWVAASEPASHAPATTLGPNITRVLQALINTSEIPAHAPDREHVRFTPSGFLLTELPLGKFVQDRYGAPHLNIDTDALNALLDPGLSLTDAVTLEQLEAQHRVVAVTAPDMANTAAATHQLYWASLPAAAPDRANVTWLGDSHVAWQFSTATTHHALFCLPLTQTLDDMTWHPDLQQFRDIAAPLNTISLNPAPVREYWHAGKLVYLGGAGFGGAACYREVDWVGLEDAWVLSRMLENYEEDVDDGLREYARFRRARATRISRAAAVRNRQYFEGTALRRLGRNLNLALSARFLPEIAMQRIDWLYGHDCIRGFR